jgi:hypothetical protein
MWMGDWLKPSKLPPQRRNKSDTPRVVTSIEPLYARLFAQVKAQVMEAR